MCEGEAKEAIPTAGLPSVDRRETVWHPDHHDHIVRNRAELARILRYSQGNPQVWKTNDQYVPIVRRGLRRADARDEHEWTRWKR